MGWRDARAKVNAGFFAKKENAFESGFTNAADIIAKSWLQDAADAKKEKKENQLEDKRLRDQSNVRIQRQNELDKKHKNTAIAALKQFDLPLDSNSNIYKTAYAMAQGGATLPSIGQYFREGINSGSITINYKGEYGPGYPRQRLSVDTLTDVESGRGGANALLNQAQEGAFAGTNVSEMSVGDIMAFQQKRGPGSYHEYSKNNMPTNTIAYEKGLGSTPVGKYQFVGNTMKYLKKRGVLDELNITDDTIFTEDVQDKLFLRYAQDVIGNFNSDQGKIGAMRSAWEGLKNKNTVPDAKVLEIIKQIETGVFSGEVFEDRSLLKPPSMTFKPLEESFKEIDLSNITDYDSWTSLRTSLTANATKLSPQFEKTFRVLGHTLKEMKNAKTANEKLDKLFSIDKLLAENITKDEINARISIAESQNLKVPSYILETIVPLIEGKKEYTEKELIEMPLSERLLVEKHSQNPETVRLATEMNLTASKVVYTDQQIAKMSVSERQLLINISSDDEVVKRLQDANKSDSRRFSWIKEMTTVDQAKAQVDFFINAGNVEMYSIAEGILQSLRLKEAPYLQLIAPANLVGKTSSELNQIFRLAEMQGASKEQLEPVRKEAVHVENLEKIQGNNDYFAEATTHDRTQAQITLAIMNNAPQEVIKHLENIAFKQSKYGEKLSGIKYNGTGTQAVDAIINIGGVLQVRVLYQKPGLGNLVTATGEEVPGALLMSEIQTDQYNTVRTETQQLVLDISKKSAAIAGAMRTAALAIELVDEDSRVREGGGSAAKLIRNITSNTEGVLSVTAELFEKQEEVSIQDLKKAGFSADFLDAVVSGNVQNLATKSAIFEATILSLVFQAGRMEGTFGASMSNQDFKQLMTIINTEGSEKAFRENLIFYMNSKVKAYDDDVFGLMNNTPSIKQFKDDYDFYPIPEPLSMKDFVSQRNESSLTSAYEMITGQVVKEKTTASSSQTVDSYDMEEVNKFLLENPTSQNIIDYNLAFGEGTAQKVLEQGRGK